MNHDWQRFAAIVMLALLGGGIVAWLIVSVGIRTPEPPTEPIGEEQ